MKVILTESACFHMEDTIIGAIAKSKNIDNLIKNANCLDLFITYENNLGNKDVFKIYYAGVYNEDEYNRFAKNKYLPKIKLLTDDYDIIINEDKFERECTISIKKY